MLWFSEHVKKAVAAFDDANAPESIIAIIEFKEYNAQFRNWKLFRLYMYCSEYAFARLEADERFYQNSGYKWQPELICLIGSVKVKELFNIRRPYEYWVEFVRYVG